MSDSVPIALRELIEVRLENLAIRIDRYVEEHRGYHRELADEVGRDAARIAERLSEMNRLRELVMAERALYITRDMLDSRQATTIAREEQLAALATAHFENNGKRILALEAQMANLQGRILAAGAFISFIVTLVASMTAALVNHLWR